MLHVSPRIDTNISMWPYNHTMYSCIIAQRANIENTGGKCTMLGKDLTYIHITYIIENSDLIYITNTYMIENNDARCYRKAGK
jgi:hypothetical protein